MDSNTSQEASSSSLPLFPTTYLYDVFLSFRGEDTRNNFVDHLYHALDRDRVYTFKDEERLERGKSIAPELLKAIEESMFAVIVVSENYASSGWCLDELVKIMECKKVRGMTVLPVFYDVDPSEVRKQTGHFGEVFAKHETDKVERWRAALVEASNLAGWDLKNTANGHESKCIQQIVGDILSKSDQTSLGDVETQAGMEPRVRDVNSLLGIGSNDVRFIGIWGMSGIGKTTIARVIFDKISHQFDGHSFLHEVREASKKCGLHHLQERLLSEILMERGLKISNVYAGRNHIKRRLRRRKVLVVLDDVDHLDQLDGLAEKCEWFGMGSRIIITTRDEQLLVAHNVDIRYKVSVLNYDEAIQLFSWKAFNKSKPAKGYEELSNCVVRYAGGLPLAVKVLGSFLCRRDKTQWNSALDRLKDVPEDEIMEKLQLSFDGLKDEEQQIFLDIACFFKVETENYVKRILDSFGFHSDIGLHVLIQKSLVDVSNDRLEMHNLIQEMGWHIVRKEHPREPGRHSRLWRPEEVCVVLTGNMATEAVEGIVVNLEEKYVDIITDAFRKMNKLRLLKVHNTYWPQGVEYLPNELRWLNWHGYDSESLPACFQAPNLVGLEMWNSHIIQLWNGTKLLDKLKFINLSWSQKLTSTPDFREIPNLQRLDLEDCSSLVEVHPSIAIHKKLISLNFRGCKNLKFLPKSIQMESLEVFDLSGCVKLRNFPEIQGNMERLLKIFLDGTAIEELPSSIADLDSLILIDLRNCGNLTSLPSSFCSLTCLESLDLSGCSNLTNLPSSICRLTCLKSLRLCGCSKLFQASTSLVLPSLSGFKWLRMLDLSDCNLLTPPDGLGCLSSLEELNLSGNSFSNLPDSINRLSHLRILQLVECKWLEALPQLPSNIVELYADDCTALKGHLLLLTKFYDLHNVSLTNCFQLVDDSAYTLWQCVLRYLSTCLVQGLRKSYCKFSIHFPGTEIPKCFSYQGMGRFISVDLAPQWYNNKFAGFVFCAVFEPILAMKGMSRIVIKMTNHGGSESKTIGMILKYKNIDSKHIFLTYIGGDVFKEYLNSPNDFHQVSFTLDLDEGPYVTKQWGVHLSYVDDVIKVDKMMVMQSSSQCGKSVLSSASFDRALYEIADGMEFKRKRDANRGENSGSDVSSDDEILHNRKGKKLVDDASFL